MNIAERLTNGIKRNIQIDAQKIIRNYRFNPSDFFAEQSELDNMLYKLASDRRCFIFMCSKSFDVSIIEECLRAKLNIDSIEDTASYNNIKNTVKMLENSIYGAGALISGLALNNFESVIHKLKLLIALNNKNLTSENILALLGASKPVLIYVSKNDAADDVFYISKIEEVLFNESETELVINSLFEFDAGIKNEKAAENEEDNKPKRGRKKSAEKDKKSEKSVKRQSKEKVLKKEKEIKLEKAPKKRGRPAGRKQKSENSQRANQQLEIEKQQTVSVSAALKEETRLENAAPGGIKEQPAGENPSVLEAGGMKSQNSKEFLSKADTAAKAAADAAPVSQSAGRTEFAMQDELARRFMQEETKYQSEETGRKINKYQMLKEKARRKNKK